MKCPACNAPLETREYHGLQIDQCASCRGVWFDEHELGNFIRLYLEEHPETPHSVITLVTNTDAAERVAEQERICPKCDFPLQKINYGYNSGIVLDKCLACEGVWADRARVKQLAIYTKGNPKLDKLAGSVAEHVKENEESRENFETAAALTAAVPLGGMIPGLNLPLQDDTERQRMPFVTVSLILANGAALAGIYNLGYEFKPVFAAYGFVPARILEGNGLYTFFSSMFLHAGVFHLACNMLFLWIFGDNVEDTLGHIRFLLFYCICGICASLAFLALHADSTVPCVGASGAIAGVLGAYCVFFPKARIKTFMYGAIVSVPALVYLGLWFLLQAMYCLVWENYGAGGIAFSAHVAGFLAGVALAVIHQTFVHREVLPGL